MKQLGFTQILKYRLFAFMILSVVITSILTGLSAAIPYYTYIKNDYESKRIQSARNHARLVDSYLDSLKQVADQVTSRSFARKQLDLFSKGEITHIKHNTLVKPVLKDAMKKLPEMISLLRYDAKGFKILQIGEMISSEQFAIHSEIVNHPTIYGPININNQQYIYTRAPITHNNNIIGHDIIIFSLKKIEQIINKPDDSSLKTKITLSWIKDNRINHFFTHDLDPIYNDNTLFNTTTRQGTEKFGSTSNSDKKYKFYFSYLNNIDWIISLKIKNKDAYSPLMNQISTTFLVMTVLVITGVLSTLFILKPLSGQIFIHSDELQEEVNRKTAELKQLNDSLNTLNTANEMLLHSVSEQELLDDIACIFIDSANFDAVWVSTYNSYDTEHMHTVSQEGKLTKCLNMEELMQDDIRLTKTLVGKAITNLNSLVIHNEAALDCFDTYWTENCESKLGTVAAFPMVVDDKVQGIIVAYSDNKLPIDNRQSQILQRLSNNLAYGIIALREKNTRQKLQTKLAQSEKMEAIGQLSGFVSHEFNNTLIYILGHTELMYGLFPEDLDKTEIDDHLLSIRNSISNAKQKLTQLLSFSSTSETETHPYKLEPLLIESLDILKSTFPQDIEITLTIDDHDSKVMMNALQFNQILVNLCMNARHAMSDIGKLEIILRRSKIKDTDCSSCHDNLHGEYDELIVKDNGQGIDKEHINRIFEPFYTTKKFGRGSGMGLSVVHGIVHELDGHILVRSTPDEGTSFHLLFPILS